MKVNFTDEEMAEVEAAASKAMRSTNSFVRVATLLRAQKAKGPKSAKDPIRSDQVAS